VQILYKGSGETAGGCKVLAIVMRPCPRKRPEIFIGKQERVKLHVHLFDGFSPTPRSSAV